MPHEIDRRVTVHKLDELYTYTPEVECTTSNLGSPVFWHAIWLLDIKLGTESRGPFSNTQDLKSRYTLQVSSRISLGSIAELIQWEHVRIFPWEDAPTKSMVAE